MSLDGPRTTATFRELHSLLLVSDSSRKVHEVSAYNGLYLHRFIAPRS